MIRHFSLALAAASTALFMAPAMASDSPPEMPQMVGGYSAMSLESDDSIAIAKTALRLVGDDPMNFVQILSAEQQVVAGMNYRMQIQIGTGEVWAVTVYRNLQGEYSVTMAEKQPALPVTSMKLNNNGFVVMGTDGSVTPVAFGTPKADTMAAISFRPDAGESTLDECGAGSIAFASWPDGLNLLFQDDSFVGWSLDERGDGIPFVGDIGIGVTLASLQQAGQVHVEDTSLGYEFIMMGETGDVAGISGILEAKDETGKVLSMWAGTSCNFR